MTKLHIGDWIKVHGGDYSYQGLVVEVSRKWFSIRSKGQGIPTEMLWAGYTITKHIPREKLTKWWRYL